MATLRVLFNLCLVIVSGHVGLTLILEHSTPASRIEADEVDHGLVAGSFDLSSWSKATASSTCGQSGPEEFCYLTDLGLNKGHDCEICDDKSPKTSHPVLNILDGTTSWWKSANAQEQVTIDIDLVREFYVSHVIVTMGPSPRPANWLLERSVDFGKSYRPWQFFAENQADCMGIFGTAPNLPAQVPDQVLCHSETFKVLKNEEVFVMLIKGRPGDANFATNSKLQDWSRATNVRLRFLRLQTLEGERIHNDVSMNRRHFYSIQGVAVGGRCICHGHEEGCIFDQTINQIRCICTGNTCGPSCAECCPAFHHRLWSKTEPCQPCNCFAHANRCVYNETVAKLRLSVDSKGNYGGGGGVCQGCLHNTEGINCERCQRGFYRVPGSARVDTKSCQACECNPRGSVGHDDVTCHPDDGQCKCRNFVGGRSCDQCIFTYWSFPNCKPCNCSQQGSRGPTCNSLTGQCNCLEDMSGLKCDTCLRATTQVLTTGGCLNCDACGIDLVNKSTSLNVSVVAHWTQVTRLDLASHPNFLQRKLDYFQRQLDVARNLAARMPIPELKAIHDASVLSILKNSLVTLSSQWDDVKFTWMMYRSKAAILLCNDIVTNVTRVTYDLNSVTSELMNNTRMLKSHRNDFPNCDKLQRSECWTFMDGSVVREMTGTLADNLSAAKVSSYVEREQARELRNFVHRFFWTWRRVRVALAKLRDLVQSVDANSRLTSKANVRNRPLLYKLQFNMTKLRRAVAKLRLLNAPDALTKLSKDLRSSFASLRGLRRRLDATNYKVLQDWSWASLHSLNASHSKHLRPHADILARKAATISRLYGPLRKELQVRERLLDDLGSIARSMTEAGDSLDFVKQVKKHDDDDDDDVFKTSGSGLSPDADLDDDDEHLDIDGRENDDGKGLSVMPIVVLDTLEERRQTGLNLKRQNLFLKNRVEGVRLEIHRNRNVMEDVKMALSRTAHDLKVVGLYKSPLVVASVRRDLQAFKKKTNYIQNADLQRFTHDGFATVRGAHKNLEAVASDNLLKLPETQWKVLNVTAAVNTVKTLAIRRLRLIESWQVLAAGSFRSKLAGLKDLISNWHKAASRYQMAVSLDGSHLQLPVQDLMFEHSVATRIEMAFRSTLSDSFLLMIGTLEYGHKVPAPCQILVYLERSILTVSLRRGADGIFVRVHHPLHVLLDTWYHFGVHWVLDRFNVTLREVKNKNATLMSVQATLPTGSFPTRRFEPAIVFVGRLPGDWKLGVPRNLHYFRGCVDSLKVNGRLIGLISPTNTRPCLTPAIAPSDRLDILSFDGQDVLCVAVPSNSALMAEFRLRTIQRNSVVIFMKFHSQAWLAVVIKNGELMVELSNSDDKSRNDTTLNGQNHQLTLPSGRRCNDGLPHTVQLSVSGNSLHLTVDTLYRNSHIILQFGALTVDQVHLGGLPISHAIDDEESDVALQLCYATNFQGCLMDFKFANKTPVATSALTTAAVTCPTSLGFDCLCSSGLRPIQLKKLDFVVKSLTVAFALRQASQTAAKNRTVLYYSTSPYSGFEVEVGQLQFESKSVTVWFWSRGSGRVGGDWRHLVNETWHFIRMSTNQNSTVVTVDDDVFPGDHGLVHQRFYASQHRLFLGPGRQIDVTPDGHFQAAQPAVCYKELIINEGSVDLSEHLDASTDATTCPVTL